MHGFTNGKELANSINSDFPLYFHVTSPTALMDDYVTRVHYIFRINHFVHKNFLLPPDFENIMTHDDHIYWCNHTIRNVTRKCSRDRDYQVISSVSKLISRATLQFWTHACRKYEGNYVLSNYVCISLLYQNPISIYHREKSLEIKHQFIINFNKR